MQIKNENNKTFETADFYLAAFCLAKGLRLIDIIRDDPRRVVFIFKDEKDRATLVEVLVLFFKAENPRELRSLLGAGANPLGACS